VRTPVGSRARNSLGGLEMAIYRGFCSLHCDAEQPCFRPAFDHLVSQTETEPVKTRFEVWLYGNSEALVLEGMQ
jgi:hypothetical protein